MDTVRQEKLGGQKRGWVGSTAIGRGDGTLFSVDEETCQNSVPGIAEELTGDRPCREAASLTQPAVDSLCIATEKQWSLRATVP